MKPPRLFLWSFLACLAAVVLVHAVDLPPSPAPGPVLAWNYPARLTTNIEFRVYSSTTVDAPMSDWTLIQTIAVTNTAQKDFSAAFPAKQDGAIYKVAVVSRIYPANVVFSDAVQDEPALSGAVPLTIKWGTK